MIIYFGTIKVEFTLFIDRYSDTVDFAHTILLLIDILIKTEVVLESTAATPCNSNAQRDVFCQFLFVDYFVDFFGGVFRPRCLCWGVRLA